MKIKYKINHGNNVQLVISLTLFSFLSFQLQNSWILTFFFKEKQFNKRFKNCFSEKPIRAIRADRQTAPS